MEEVTSKLQGNKRKQKELRMRLIKAPVYDEFAICGFKASRTSEFEIKYV